MRRCRAHLGALARTDSGVLASDGPSFSENGNPKQLSESQLLNTLNSPDSGNHPEYFHPNPTLCFSNS